MKNKGAFRSDSSLEVSRNDVDNRVMYGWDSISIKCVRICLHARMFHAFRTWFSKARSRYRPIANPKPNLTLISLSVCVCVCVCVCVRACVRACVCVCVCVLWDLKKDWKHKERKRPTVESLFHDGSFKIWGLKTAMARESEERDC